MNPESIFQNLPKKLLENLFADKQAFSPAKK